MSQEDLWKDPTVQAWVEHVIEEMAPKLEASAFTISLVPEDRSGDVKYWVELGASICMDKPIIVVALGNAPLPGKLELVADEIIYCPDGVDPASTDLLTEAIKRTVENLNQ